MFTNGLHLTAANLVIFAELFWNPGALVQAEDRAYRIGQMDSVLVRYLIAEQTADDFIWPLVERKLEVLSKAGLNRETFRMTDSITRLSSNNTLEQQKILDYFKTELNDFEEWENFDTVLPIINEDRNSNAQFENTKKLDNHNTNENKLNPAQPKMITSLLRSKSQSSLANNDPIVPNENNTRKRLLVPSSPESNHSETFSNKADHDDDVVVVDDDDDVDVNADHLDDDDDLMWVDNDFIDQIDESDITDNNAEEFSATDDDYLISEAVKIAEAVEVDWLTDSFDQKCE
ncbi:unnamed protein product [Schistosoma turkestanicum]|nr:unnamed protein product [Schistosoma turkestanicum]